MFNLIKNVSPTELIIIILILVVLFGGKLVTRLARMSGETVRELKTVKKEFGNYVNDEKKNSNS